MLVLDPNNYLGNVIHANHSEFLCIGKVLYDGNGAFDNIHCHENPHFSLVINGGNIEKRTHTSFERLPGMATFYHAGEVHQNIYREIGSSHINIEIKASWLRNHWLYGEQINIGCTTNPNSTFLILKMYKELLSRDEFSIDTMKLLLFELLDARRENISHMPKWINMLKELLNDRWNEIPTLDDLSAAVKVHPVTISKYFSKYFGCTLGEYMRKQKVSRAISLMKTTHVSLTDIAYECGFSDQSHFIRTFKQFTGLLPREYRIL